MLINSDENHYMLLAKSLRKLKVGGIIPEPYSLFTPKLKEKDPHEFGAESQISGIDLFVKVAGYHSLNANHTAWKLLSPEQQKEFISPHPQVNVHLQRIAQAYKDVDTHVGDNPYYNAWLYPWEIIKDKLRMRWMFGADIYDTLIIEALTLTKSQITPKALWRGDVEWREEKQDLGLVQSDEIILVDLFRKLPTTVKNEYIQRSIRKTEYCERLRQFNSARKVPTTPFQTFFKSEFAQLDSGMSLQEKSKFLGVKWKSLSEDEKSKFKGTEVSAKGRIHREKLLDAKTEMVMDYICGGYVEGWSGDWREWRREVGGGMYYLDKIYFPYIVQKRGSGIEMYKHRI